MMTDEQVGETKDGEGAADNDKPYAFGRRPRTIAPYPFTEHEFARLLILRGRRLAELLDDDTESDGETWPV